MVGASFVVVLTFVVPFAGATVEQTSVKCADLACVETLAKDCMSSPVCTRFRVWVADEFAPLQGLRAFVWPPYKDWQRA